MENWKRMPDKNGHEIYIAEREDTYSGIMGVSTFNYTPEQILLFIQKEDSMLKANPLLENLKLIEMMSERDLVFYMKIKGMFVVASRDIVGISHTITREDGTMAIFIYSMEHPDAPEPPEKVVRADMMIGGWHFVPVDENSTKVYNFAINDYKGNVPKFILNLGASTQGVVFKSLLDQMAEAEKENKLEGAKEFQDKFGFKLVNGKHEKYA